MFPELITTRREYDCLEKEYNNLDTLTDSMVDDLVDVHCTDDYPEDLKVLIVQLDELGEKCIEVEKRLNNLRNDASCTIKKMADNAWKAAN